MAAYDSIWTVWLAMLRMGLMTSADRHRFQVSLLPSMPAAIAATDGPVQPVARAAPDPSRTWAALATRSSLLQTYTQTITLTLTLQETAWGAAASPS